MPKEREKERKSLIEPTHQTCIQLYNAERLQRHGKATFLLGAL
jgi:hypothetical protein